MKSEPPLGTAITRESTPEPSSSGLLKAIAAVAGLGIVGVLLFVSPGWLAASSSGPETTTRLADAVTKPVVRDSFEVTILVQGNMDSQSNVTLASEVEGESTIITIVPEGTRVQEGDLVVELDSAEIREEFKQQQIDVTQAEAKLAQAKENLEIQQTQNESDISAAMLNAKLAQLDLEKYRDGEYPQEESELSGEMALAEEESVRASENYEFSRTMVKKGYKTPNEAEADRIAVRSAELKLQQAREKHKVLTKYTRKRQIAELTANAKEFELELTRARLKAKAAETQAKAELDAAKLTYEVELEKLDRSRRMIDACRIIAPQAGEVVYANDEGGRRGDGVDIEEGAKVRERQAIVKLPDTSQMQVESRIHESRIGNIREGLPVKITVVSYPDYEFDGVVSSVSNVPMSGRFPNYDLREYATEFKLVGDPEKIRELRPGLTAQVEIIVDDRDDVLQVPRQAIVNVGSKKVVFVLDGSKPEGAATRYVTLGATNDSFAEVLDGLAEGDEAILNPQSKFPDQIEELQKLHRVAVPDEESQSAGDESMGGPPGNKPGGKPRREGKPKSGKGKRPDSPT